MTDNKMKKKKGGIINIHRPFPSKRVLVIIGGSGSGKTMRASEHTHVIRQSVGWNVSSSEISYIEEIQHGGPTVAFSDFSSGGTSALPIVIVDMNDDEIDSARSIIRQSGLLSGIHDLLILCTFEQYEKAQVKTLIKNHHVRYEVLLFDSNDKHSMIQASATEFDKLYELFDAATGDSLTQQSLEESAASYKTKLESSDEGNP